MYLLCWVIHSLHSDLIVLSSCISAFMLSYCPTVSHSHCLTFLLSKVLTHFLITSPCILRNFDLALFTSYFPKTAPAVGALTMDLTWGSVAGTRPGVHGLRRHGFLWVAMGSYGFGCWTPARRTRVWVPTGSYGFLWAPMGSKRRDLSIQLFGVVAGIIIPHIIYTYIFIYR